MRPAETIRSVSAGGSAREKRHYWNDMVAQAIEPADFRTRDWESFAASMRSRSLGTRDLTLIHSDPWQASTTSEMVLAHRSDRVTVAVCLSGEFAYDHEGSSATISVGKAAVIDSRRVHRLRGESRVKLLCLSLEWADLGGALKAIEAPVVLSKSDPMAAVTLDLIKRTWRSLPQLDAEQRPTLQPKLGRMVAECLARQRPDADPQTSHVVAMIYRAKQIVMERIGEVAFGPIALAEALGVTRRYLTSLFQTIEDTPGDYIRRLRLHTAWDALTDARSPAPIRAIGASVGIIDNVQFTKSFKSAYGRTPQQIRQLRMG